MKKVALSSCCASRKPPIAMIMKFRVHLNASAIANVYTNIALICAAFLYFCYSDKNGAYAATGTSDPCNTIKCSTYCTGICGWNSNVFGVLGDGVCVTGGFTDPALEQNLGYCESTTPSPTSSPTQMPLPEDMCNLILCGAECTGTCGWSSLLRKCVTGQRTTAKETVFGPGCPCANLTCGQFCTVAGCGWDSSYNQCTQADSTTEDELWLGTGCPETNAPTTPSPTAMPTRPFMSTSTFEPFTMPAVGDAKDCDNCNFNTSGPCVNTQAAQFRICTPMSNFNGFLQCLPTQSTCIVPQTTKFTSTLQTCTKLDVHCSFNSTGFCFQTESGLCLPFKPGTEECYANSEKCDTMTTIIPTCSGCAFGSEGECQHPGTKFCLRSQSGICPNGMLPCETIVLESSTAVAATSLSPSVGVDNNKLCTGCLQGSGGCMVGHTLPIEDQLARICFSLPSCPVGSFDCVTGQTVRIPEVNNSCSPAGAVCLIDMTESPQDRDSGLFINSAFTIGTLNIQGGVRSFSSDSKTHIFTTDSGRAAVLNVTMENQLSNTFGVDSFSLAGGFDGTVANGDAQVGDFNGDGTADVVMISGELSDVVVFLSNSVGNFLEGQVIRTYMNSTTNVLLTADLSANGRTHILIGLSNGPLEILEILHSGLTINPQTDVSVTPVQTGQGNIVHAMVVSDFDGDGIKNDILVLNENSSDANKGFFKMYRIREDFTEVGSTVLPLVVDIATDQEPAMLRAIESNDRAADVIIELPASQNIFYMKNLGSNNFDTATEIDSSIFGGSGAIITDMQLIDAGEHACTRADSSQK